MSSVSIQGSSFCSSKPSSHEIFISCRHFEYAVTVTIPGNECSKFHEAVKLAGDSFVRVEEVPLTTFIQPAFIKDIICGGWISALSVNDQLDTGDVVALLPSGTLVLSLTKESFQELGLDGRPSQFNRTRKTGKHIVEIDLKREDFKPGEGFYERVQTRLASHPELKFTFLLACERSIEPLLLLHLKSFTCHHHHLSHSTHTCHDIPVPTVSGWSLPVGEESGCGTSAESAAGVMDFQEWLGMVACQCNLNGGDDYLSTYECPSPREDSGEVFHEKWRGFIPATTVSQILAALR
ncbi:ribonuclease P protein subunit p40-like [Diadema setosum]|uniref:ribonuclease P protein subunit p40-like n=1 Tax=Diadema setosum TaxID=31175 RepID=UPI003B3B5529